jgi:pSer/pThr/pTyr-binding forkhead associated (FHA) protein
VIKKLIDLFRRESDEPPGEGENPKKEATMDPSIEIPQNNQGQNMSALGQDSIFGLKFILSPDDDKTFTSLPITIGRSQQNDIVLDDETISAVHAHVYFDDRINDVCIVDIDSLNGLFVDDYPTYRNVLQDGVRLKLGRVVITFRDTGYIHSGA